MFPGTIDRAADERISSVPLPHTGPIPAAPQLPSAQRERKPSNTSTTVATLVFFTIGVVLFLAIGLRSSPGEFLVRFLIWSVIFGAFALFCKFETPGDFLQVAIFFFLATLFEVSVVAGAVALAGFILHMAMVWGSPEKESPREPEREASNPPPLLPTVVESDGLWIKGVYFRVATAIVVSLMLGILGAAIFLNKKPTAQKLNNSLIEKPFAAFDAAFPVNANKPEKVLPESAPISQPAHSGEKGKDPVWVPLLPWRPKATPKEQAKTISEFLQPRMKVPEVDGIAAQAVRSDGWPDKIDFFDPGQRVPDFNWLVLQGYTAHVRRYLPFETAAGPGYRVNVLMTGTSGRPRDDNVVQWYIRSPD